MAGVVGSFDLPGQLDRTGHALADHTKSASQRPDGRDRGCHEDIAPRFSGGSATGTTAAAGYAQESELQEQRRAWAGPCRICLIAIVVGLIVLFAMSRLENASSRTYGCRAGPNCGARTGFAMPKKITTPWPPQRVESASLALLKQLSMSCQLFITHTSPEGEMARSVCICRPPPT